MIDLAIQYSSGRSPFPKHGRFFDTQLGIQYQAPSPGNNNSEAGATAVAPNGDYIAFVYPLPVSSHKQLYVYNGNRTQVRAERLRFWPRVLHFLPTGELLLPDWYGGTPGLLVTNPTSGEVLRFIPVITQYGVRAIDVTRFTAGDDLLAAMDRYTPVLISLDTNFVHDLGYLPPLDPYPWGTAPAIVRVSNSGKFLAYGAGSHFVVKNLLSPDKGVIQIKPPGYIYGMAFDKDDAHLLLSTREGILVFETNTWTSEQIASGWYTEMCVSHDFTRAYALSVATYGLVAVNLSTWGVSQPSWFTPLARDARVGELASIRGTHDRALPPAGPFWTLLKHAQQAG